MKIVKKIAQKLWFAKPQCSVPIEVRWHEPKIDIVVDNGRDLSESDVGDIFCWPSDMQVPEKWITMEGQRLPINKYYELYRSIGKTHQVYAFAGTFRLPYTIDHSSHRCHIVKALP